MTTQSTTQSTTQGTGQPLPSAPVRVGLIGGGGIATAHIRGYEAAAGRIRIAAVADAFEATARSRGEELGVPHFTDYAEMIASAEIGAVIASRLARTASSTWVKSRVCSPSPKTVQASPASSLPAKIATTPASPCGSWRGP